MTTPRIVLAVATLAVLTSGPITTAHAQGAADIVKQRLDLMKGFGRSYGELVRALRGEAANGATIGALGEAMHGSAQRVGNLFPPGTGPEAGVETRAKPEVWSDRAGFEAALAALVQATGTLAQVAKTGDRAATEAQLNKVGEACGGCHGGPVASGGKYRAERRS